MTTDDDELIAYLTRSTQLDRQSAAQVLDTIFAHYNETLEEFVVRRHGELRADGVARNPAIFATIADEVPRRRFSVATPSVRQIRRLIYS